MRLLRPAIQTVPLWSLRERQTAMKITAIAAATIIAATSAHADTYWYCKGDECVGRSVGPTNPLGTYINPIQDELEGDCRFRSIAGRIARLAHGTTVGCGHGNAAQ